MREEYAIPALKCTMISLSAVAPSPYEQGVAERIKVWLRDEVGLSGAILDKKLSARYIALVAYCFPELSADDLFFATVFMYYFFEIDDFAEDPVNSSSTLMEVTQQHLRLFWNEEVHEINKATVFGKMTLSLNRLLIKIKLSRNMDAFIHSMARYFQALIRQKTVITNQVILSSEEFLELRHATGGVEQLIYLGVCLVGHPISDAQYQEIGALVFVGDVHILCANDLFSVEKEKVDQDTFPFCNLIGHKILREGKDEVKARQEVLELTNSSCDEYLEKKASYGLMSFEQALALKYLENLMGANIVWSLQSGRYHLVSILSLTKQDLNFRVSFDAGNIGVDVSSQQGSVRVRGSLLCLTEERINPFYEVACSENQVWVSRFKLCDDSEKKLAKSDLEELVACCFIDTTDVVLLGNAMRLITWVTTLDDIVDEDWQSLQRDFSVEQLTSVFRVFFQALTGTLPVDFDLTSSAFYKFPKIEPLVKSALDIHNKLAKSGVDLTLFNMELERLLLEGLVQEFRIRTEGLKQTLKEYGSLRKVVVFSYVFFELGLAFKGFSAKHPLRQDPYFIKFYHTAAKALFLSNNVFSSAKEIQAGGTGYIFYRATEKRESLQESFNQLVVRYNEAIKKLILINRALHAREDILQDMPAKQALRCLIHCVQGILAWRIKTQRYIVGSVVRPVASKPLPDTYFLKHSFFDPSKLNEAYAERNAESRKLGRAFVC